MKHFACILLSVLCLLFASCTSGRYPNSGEPASGQQYPGIGTPVSSDEVKLIQRNWSDPSCSFKMITGDMAALLLGELNSLAATGETVSRLSKGSLTNYRAPKEVPPGTMWIEADGRIYRTTPALEQICRVETHLGAGEVLSFPQSLRTLLNQAWRYWPYDCWQGSYRNGNLELSHVFDANSDLQITVCSLEIERKIDPKNRITLELLSETDQAVKVQLECQQSDDNLAAGDAKTVELKAGKPQTVTLSFGGWENDRYWVYVFAGNTRVELTVEP